MKTLITLSFALIFSACTSTTWIRTADPETKIWADGEFKGKGSVEYSDTKTSGSQTSIRLEKVGCAPQFYNMTRNEQYDILPCVTGIFIAPLFWIQKYKPEHFYDYTCEKPQ